MARVPLPSSRLQERHLVTLAHGMHEHCGSQANAERGYMTSRVGPVVEIVASEDDDGLRVHVGKDITVHNSVHVCSAVYMAWTDRRRPQRITLDLSGARRIDSSGVGALMEIRERTNRLGARLVLCGLEESPRRLLERTGLIRLFEVGETAGNPAIVPA